MEYSEQKSNSREMSKEEILYQQLKLLAEESQKCPSEELPQLTVAMCEVYRLLN